MAYRVTFIPGDGTGPEIAEATRRVLEATGVAFDWDVQDVGVDVMAKEGTPLPDRAIESLKSTKLGIKGPVTTPIGTGFRSVNVALRKALQLYACVRPCKVYPGVRTRYADAGVDIVVMRENTEDLYAGIEFEEGSPYVKQLSEDRHGERPGRHPRRRRHQHQDDLRVRHAPHREVRLRVRAQERPQEGFRRLEGEHHEVHRRPLLRRQPRGREGLPRHRVRRGARRRALHAARPAAGMVRRAAAARTSTATSSPTSAPASSAASASRPARISATSRRSSSRSTAARRSTPARTK